MLVILFIGLGCTSGNDENNNEADSNLTTGETSTDSESTETDNLTQEFLNQTKPTLRIREIPYSISPFSKRFEIRHGKLYQLSVISGLDDSSVKLLAFNDLFTQM